MPEFSIPRTGRSPLRFNGEMLAEATSRTPSQKKKQSWHEIRTYQTPKGKYILEIAYRSDFRREPGASTVEVCNRVSDLRSMLSTYDPTHDVTGIRADGSIAQPPADFLDGLRRRFAEAVEEVLRTT